MAVTYGKSSNSGFSGNTSNREQLEQRDKLESYSQPENSWGVISRETGLIILWSIIGIVALLSVLWVMAGYDDNHQNVLTRPLPAERLDEGKVTPLTPLRMQY